MPCRTWKRKLSGTTERLSKGLWVSSMRITTHWPSPDYAPTALSTCTHRHRGIVLCDPESKQSGNLCGAVSRAVDGDAHSAQTGTTPGQAVAGVGRCPANGR